ncbi:undecaprenol kinase [Streptococcus pneumoniae]|nr:undecaprenol kinase [Streptococcus pneumoniae]
MAYSKYTTWALAVANCVKYNIRSMYLIEILKSIFFGIVEGITEWLPISSTGHLILAEEFIQYQNQNEAFMSMFNVVIQLGAILAVMVIYFNKLNPFKPTKDKQEVQ